MILIGQYDSPFVRRVAVTLCTYRIPFERNPLSVFGNIGQVRAYNPLVRVPALVLDDTEVLIESSLIVDYLDGLVGASKALIPDEGVERRRVQQLAAIAQGTAEKVVQLFFERYFHDPQHRSKDFEHRCIDQIETGLEALEAHCTDHWMFGERISHADVMAGCMLGHLQLRVPDIFPEQKYAKLRAFHQRCELNRAFVAARISANETIPARG
jgi:glutathione S-transferase